MEQIRAEMEQISLVHDGHDALTVSSAGAALGLANLIRSKAAVPKSLEI